MRIFPISKWEDLNREIDHFEEMLNIPQSFASLIVSRNWKEIWATAKEIQEAFRSIRFPKKEDRERAWERFAALRSRAASESQEERDKRQWTSERLRNDILKQAERGRPDIFFADREALQAFGRELHEAGQMLSRHKQEMLAEHKNECFERIQEVRKVQEAFWAELKKKSEKKHSEWRERTRANLEKNRERYDSIASALSRKREFANTLRSEIASAWNPSWADRKSEKLSEVENEIEELERVLHQIEGWIREGEEKLN